MIKSISVTNFHNETLEMVLNNPRSSGFIIKNITGIGAGQANINISEMATTDGGEFNSARVSPRNIVFDIQFLLDGTEASIERYRRRSYRYFPLKKNVKLRFTTDNGNRLIEGYVESNEPNIFSNEEDTQISIMCPDPYFYDESMSIYTLSGIESLFEFPFSNESLTDNLIEFSRIIENKSVTFDYLGDSDTGVVIRMLAKKPVNHIYLTNASTSQTMHIDSSRFPSSLSGGIKENDIIEISTYIGKRYANLLRGRRRYNIINSLGRYTDWVYVQSGLNYFMYKTNTDDSSIDVSLYYTTKYDGI